MHIVYLNGDIRQICSPKVHFVKKKKHRIYKILVYHIVYTYDLILIMQRLKKSRDPRWEEEFQFVLEEPPTNDKLHVEVVSTSSKLGLLHGKVRIISEFFTCHASMYCTNMYSFLDTVVCHCWDKLAAF